MPDTELPPPLTAKDVAVTPDAAKVESKQEAVAPAAAPALKPPCPGRRPSRRRPPPRRPGTVTADTAVADQLRDIITGKLDRIVPPQGRPRRRRGLL